MEGIAVAMRPFGADGERCVGVNFVCRRLAVDRKTVYKWIDEGFLSAMHLPGVGYRIRYQDLIDFESKYRLRTQSGPCPS